MSSIESRIVPDTVQLIVEVAGLCSSAPAFEVTRPAGIAPRRSAHRKRSYQCSRTSSRSTSASARATRLYVSSIVLSTGVPSLAVRRYFLSQMSSEASWKAIESTSFGSIFTTVFIGQRRSGFYAAVEYKSKGKFAGPEMAPRSARQPRPLGTLLSDSDSSPGNSPETHLSIAGAAAPHRWRAIQDVVSGIRA